MTLGEEWRMTKSPYITEGKDLALITTSEVVVTIVIVIIVVISIIITPSVVVEQPPYRKREIRRD